MFLISHNVMMLTRILNYSGRMELTEVWVITLKAKKQQLVLIERQDTVRQIDETLTNPELIGSQGITVQLGAFRDKSNAMELMKQLKARYGDRLRLVFEDGFYKLASVRNVGSKKRCTGRTE